MNTTKIGLGLAAIGRPEYINIRGNTNINKSEEAFKDNAFSILDFAYKKGVQYFDTAPSYGKGEQFLTLWNAKHRYKDVKLSTKWGYTYVANWELGYTGSHEIKEHSLKKLLEQWQVSQKLLPALKIYQIHSATLESGVLENKAVLKQLHQIKHDRGLQIGLTTSGANQGKILEAALKVKVEGEELFDSFQVTYNILDQSTHSVLKHIIGRGKTIIIKEALANGRVFKNDAYPQYQQLYSMLQRLSAKYNVGVDAIALRFVMDALQPKLVLSGASNALHLEQNLKALNFCLEPEDLIQLQSFKIDPHTYWTERNRLEWG